MLWVGWIQARDDHITKMNAEPINDYHIYAPEDWLHSSKDFVFTH